MNSIKLSTNLNKIALLRNSRGNETPNLIEMAKLVISAGSTSITLHPRKDSRHATIEDVISLSNLDEIKNKKVELNIEGDLRPELIHIIKQYAVHQFTVVPVQPGELTSSRGWSINDDENELIKTIKYLKPHTKISLFVDAERSIIEYAAKLGVNAIEIYTYHYSLAYGTKNQESELEKICSCADLARTLGLKIHLGHDLNLDNISLIAQRVKPDEISIGHALISESLASGLPIIIDKYLSNLILL